MIPVYKYYSPTDYNFDALENHYFFFSKAEKLNDPFDVSSKLINVSPCFKEYIEKSLKGNINFSNKYGTCSFSKNGCNKPMWASYADNYSGFVVEYDEERFVELTKELMTPIPYFDVHYVDSCPNLDRKDTIIYYKNIGDKAELSFRIGDICHNGCINEKQIDRIFQYLWSIKEKDGWKHEQEKRMFLGEIPLNSGSHMVKQEDNGYKVRFPEYFVKRIIVGYNMSSDNIEKMKNIARKYGMDMLHEISVSDIPFVLEIKEKFPL